LPERFYPADRLNTLLVSPLLRGDSSPGYVVFERGAPNGFVYDSLLEQINVAYKRILLLDQLLEQVRLREIAERERLEKEMQIASCIQTGILPRTIEVDGLEISAVMLPATEVGGDYYDVVPFEGGCWIGIGDVAGHGLPTGLVMLMLQSVLGGLTRGTPSARPSEILATANQLLFDNIRRRMQQDEHVTLTLLRWDVDGKVSYAGAHEDILICRAGSGRVEQLSTPGMWVGIVKDISKMTEDSEFTLAEGDVMLLHTDGVTEAFNRHGKMFGQERLATALGRCHELPVEEIRDKIISEVHEWLGHQEDDITLLVARRRSDASYVSTRPLA
jgi:serine phosphatase RsbU (regulator of sigma subunit)